MLLLVSSGLHCMPRQKRVCSKHHGSGWVACGCDAMLHYLLHGHGSRHSIGSLYYFFFWLVFLTFLVEKNLYFSKQITHLDGWMFCQSRRKLSNTLFSDLVLNPVLNPVLNARTLHLIHCLHSVEANRRNSLKSWRGNL